MRARWSTALPSTRPRARRRARTARAVVDDEASRVETLARWCADRGT